MFEQALTTGRDGRHYWWIAPTYSQAKIAYSRMKRGLPPGFWRANDSELILRAPNGAVLDFKTAEKPDHLYGEDVWAVVMDEATRMREAAYTAVRSTITATRGPIRIIGNVKGSRNWAYRMAREAEAGEPDMHYAHITAADAVEAGVITAEEVEDARQHMAADAFRELYLAEPRDTLALIYGSFAPENVTDAAVYIPGGGPIWISYDWGFTDPTHINLFQLRDGALYGFDELVGTGTGERDWVRSVVRVITELPDYDGLSYGDWGQVWAGRASWPDPWPTPWPELAAGDPSAVQMRAEFKEHAILARTPKRVSHKVPSGQDALRALILAGGGRRFFLHPDRCPKTIDSMRNYRAQELEDGTFSDRPDPEAANHAYSHGCDGPRYLAWAERKRFGLSMMSEEQEAA